MEKLTKQEAIELHRKMWDWVADETERTGKIVNRYDYFNAMGISKESRPDSYSYCCEYAAQQLVENGCKRCQYCPLNWESECNILMCCDKEKVYDNEGLKARWAHGWRRIKKRVKLARKIANLEER